VKEKTPGFQIEEFEKSRQFLPSSRLPAKRETQIQITILFHNSLHFQEEEKQVRMVEYRWNNEEGKNEAYVTNREKRGCKNNYLETKCRANVVYMSFTILILTAASVADGTSHAA